MYKYTIRVYYDGKEGKYTAVVPEIPECTVSAETQEEVYEKIKNTLELWLKQAIKEGKDIPQEGGKKLS
ncbi:MAG: type II toxin-antitoxin system HicB family antitoxin [Candidatus Methanofastidiosia archaeon]|jgi:predicted RNase H-like HicB family nuclease